jgi:hypothetical protein
MSNFSQAWSTCMNRKGMPVPELESLGDALEYLDVLHSALENSGGVEGAVTLGGLIASGALAGVGEGTLIVLGTIAEIAALVYINAAIGCASSVASAEVRSLFASNDLPGFVVDELGQQGVDLEAQAAA